MLPIHTSEQEPVLTSLRANADHRILVALNFSGDHRNLKLHDEPHHGDWTDWQTGKHVTA